MSILGICAAVGFVVCWLGGLVSGIRLLPYMKSADGGVRVLDRTDPKAQRLHYIFVGFAASGVFSGLAGFQFGGWPADPPADPRILWGMMALAALFLAWVAFGLWKLRNSG